MNFRDLKIKDEKTVDNQLEQRVKTYTKIPAELKIVISKPNHKLSAVNKITCARTSIGQKYRCA